MPLQVVYERPGSEFWVLIPPLLNSPGKHAEHGHFVTECVTDCHRCYGYGGLGKTWCVTKGESFGLCKTWAALERLADCLCPPCTMSKQEVKCIYQPLNLSVAKPSALQTTCREGPVLFFLIHRKPVRGPAARDQPVTWATQDSLYEFVFWTGLYCLKGVN